MNAAAIAVGIAAVQVAVVYFGIYRFNLDFWRMLAAVSVLSFAGSLVMHRVSPPSQLIRQIKSRLSNKESATTDTEIALLDITGLLVTIVTAYMLITRYGLGPWFGIYIAASIASLAGYLI